MENKGLIWEQELAALVAEQEADMLYGDVAYSRELSLDAPLTHDHDAGSLSDVVGAEDRSLLALLGEDPIDRGHVPDTDISEKELAAWRYARYRKKWSYERIGLHFGHSKDKVRRRFLRGWRRESAPMMFLESRLKAIETAYQGGARLIDLADEIYQEAGYASPESCRVSLHFLFVIYGIPRRPPRWKHGLRSESATIEQQREYRNAKNALLREAGLTTRKKPLRRCPGVTKCGRRCRRLAIDSSEFCVVHCGVNTRPKSGIARTCARLCERGRTILVTVHGHLNGTNQRTAIPIFARCTRCSVHGLRHSKKRVLSLRRVDSARTLAAVS